MGKNFNGTQINQSPTISEKAGADVADIRNLILKYDTDGNVVVAADGTAPLLGVSIIEGGYNDISGVEAGKVKKGEDVDILIKDIGFVIASAEIKKGQNKGPGELVWRRKTTEIKIPVRINCIQMK